MDRYKLLLGESEKKIIHPDAWDLYHSMFKEGDEVVIVTEEEDHFEWGKIKTEKDGCRLTRPGQKSKYFDWDNIRFLAHDGFPVKKLMGADGSKTIEKIDTTKTQEAIREALSINSQSFDRESYTICKRALYNKIGRICFNCPHSEPHSKDICKKNLEEERGIKCGYTQTECINISFIKELKKPRSISTERSIFGDPYMIENFNAFLLNSGSVWTPGHENLYEEIMLLKHKTGPTGMLWGIHTCYFRESIT